MERVYIGPNWEDRPSTISPIDAINLNALSRGLETVDQRVIDNYNTLQISVSEISVDENTGNLTVKQNDGQTYSFNSLTKVYNTINANQQSVAAQFTEVHADVADVHTMLDDMDLKIDITAEGANTGIEQLRTVITQNDGYYRQEMSGIRTEVNNAYDYADAINSSTNRRITTFESSITQTTEAIQLSVSQLTTDLNGDVEALQSQINQTAGQIALKVTKNHIIDGLQEEFGSGIDITVDRITIASTGALVVNTDNFRLDEEGNAEFSGWISAAGGYIGGSPILTVNDGFNSVMVSHANHCWKLRSGATNAYDERYYAYLTSNKHFIVSNSEDAKHGPANDVSPNSTIGSKSYPWGNGYFKDLRVCEFTGLEDPQDPNSKKNYIKHNVIPEGLSVTLGSSEWQQGNGYFYINKAVQGAKGDIYLYIATDKESNTKEEDLRTIYNNQIDVSTVTDNSVRFVAKTQPDRDVSVVLLVEDFIFSDLERPVLSASYDSDLSTLSCNWSSPSDSSKFIKWVKDEIIIEKYNESTGLWEEVLVVPTSSAAADQFKEDEFEDTPLKIGQPEPDDGGGD